MNETTTTLQSFSDENGNRIEFEGPENPNWTFVFRGRNNIARIHTAAFANRVAVTFDNDNGVFEIGLNPGKRGFSATVRIGQDSKVLIGDGVTATGTVGISAVENTIVSIGTDCMFAMNVQLRADDGHAIYDVHTKRRINLSRGIEIGPHVWLGWGSTVLGGVAIGSGSVVAHSALVTKSFPNNCVIAGLPARQVRSDIAWERPHLSRDSPLDKSDAHSIQRSAWWAATKEVTAPRSGFIQRASRCLRRALKALKRRE